jgi:DNA-directed RNA polymerase subunit N (RpoN/RPB10)
MKVSEVDHEWNAIGDRLRANEQRGEALDDLIAKTQCTARQGQRRTKKVAFTDLRKASQ